MTPKKFRSILWAAEHIAGNTEVRRKWQRLALALGLTYDEFKGVVTEKIALDEKFYKVCMFNVQVIAI